jgi:putative SOS response-associated peptidase YedK
MCRDISFHSEIQIVTQDFKGIQLAPSLAHYPNEMVHVTCEVLPTHPIVVNRKALVLGKYELGRGATPTLMIPAERQKQRSNMVNARSERIIGDKKSYWYRIRQNRCLIPVTGIYEHREVKALRIRSHIISASKAANNFMCRHFTRSARKWTSTAVNFTMWHHSR